MSFLAANETRYVEISRILKDYKRYFFVIQSY